MLTSATSLLLKMSLSLLGEEARRCSGEETSRNSGEISSSDPVGGERAEKLGEMSAELGEMADELVGLSFMKSFFTIVTSKNSETL